MAEAGYTRRADGFYASATEGRFSPEIKVIAGPQNEAGMAIMGDGWRRAGFDFREERLLTGSVVRVGRVTRSRPIRRSGRSGPG